MDNISFISINILSFQIGSNRVKDSISAIARYQLQISNLRSMTGCQLQIVVIGTMARYQLQTIDHKVN